MIIFNKNFVPLNEYILSGHDRSKSFYFYYDILRVFYISDLFNFKFLK